LAGTSLCAVAGGLATAAALLGAAAVGLIAGSFDWASPMPPPRKTATAMRRIEAIDCIALTIGRLRYP
jgi:hypothetical protein